MGRCGGGCCGSLYKDFYGAYDWGYYDSCCRYPRRWSYGLEGRGGRGGRGGFGNGGFGNGGFGNEGFGGEGYGGRGGGYGGRGGRGGRGDLNTPSYFLANNLNYNYSRRRGFPNIASLSDYFVTF